MIVDKYPFLANRKQEILGLAVGCEWHEDQPNPVIVTDENGHITLFWWNPGYDPPERARWYSWERVCQVFILPQASCLTRRRRPPGEEPGIGQITACHKDVTNDFLQNQLAWSQRVGLAITNHTAYIVYRRVLEGDDKPYLYIDRIAWDTVDRQLKTVPRADGSPSPIRVPISDLPHQFGRKYTQTGFALWAGYEEEHKRLLILTQTRKGGDDRARLTLFTGNVTDPGVNLADPANWRAFDIGGGGYDLEAVMSGGEILCAYREQDYALEIPTPILSEANERRIEASAGEGMDLMIRHSPVKMLKIHPFTGEVTRTLPDIHDGYHPQIQLVLDDKIYVTVSRVGRGTLYAKANGLTELNILNRETWLYRLQLSEHSDPLQWIGGRLFSYNARYAPRSPYNPTLSSYIPFGDSNRETWQADSAARMMPLIRLNSEYLTRYHRDEEEKDSEDLDFVFHRREYEALVLTRFSVHMEVDSLQITEIGHAIIDINHAQLVKEDEINPTAYELRQFQKTIIKYRDYPALFLDNTLGGWLAADRSHAAQPVLAYTDLGDGGLRVLAGGRVFPEPVSSITPKIMNPPSEMTMSDSEFWITLSHAPNQWIPGELPGYASVNPTIGSGIDIILAKIFSMLIFLTENFGDDFAFLWEDANEMDMIILSEENLADFEDTLVYHGLDLLYDFDLGEIWRQFQEFGDAFQQLNLGTFRDITLNFSRYTLKFQWVLIPNPEAPPSTNLDDLIAELRSVHIARQANYDSELQFIGREAGQGHIRYRFPLNFNSNEFIVSTSWRPYFQVDGVEARINLQRDFSPAILTRDLRPYDLQSGELETWIETTTPARSDEAPVPAVLSAKPVGNFSTEVERATVQLSLTPVVRISVAVLVSLFLLLGLIWFPPGAIVAGVIAGVITYVWVNNVVSIAVSQIVYDNLKNIFASSNVRDLLGLNVFLYAGEGLAESIARKVLQLAGEPVDQSPPDGSCRQRRQVWQMVFVSDGNCRVKMRKQPP
ncbi:MAG: hypothetical protein BroJett011_47320 [Chloroflexota bacterium]|nr:MAG: hypothetical protein BroJett011_47320 [Chloroflexota bacterium]